LRLLSFGGYGLALAALALVVFGAIECPLFATAAPESKQHQACCLLGAAINRTGKFDGYLQ